jgi:hypothetical protein
MFVKDAIAHRGADTPHVSEVGAFATQILANLTSQAMVHSFMQRVHGATTRTLAVVFRTVGHFHKTKQLFLTEDIKDNDVLELFDYTSARCWLEAQNPSNQHSACVYGIRSVVTLEDRKVSEMLASMPVTSRCFVCHRQQAKPKKCSHCQCHWYCSRACQERHWDNGHKAECDDLGCIFSRNCLRINMFVMHAPPAQARRSVVTRALTMESVPVVVLCAALAVERHMAYVKIVKSTKLPKKPRQKTGRDEWMDMSACDKRQAE